MQVSWNVSSEAEPPPAPPPELVPLLHLPLHRKRERSSSELRSAQRRRRLSALTLELGSFTDLRISDDYYFAEMWIGHPKSQRVEMALDTGSALPYFACRQTCKKCGKHSDEPFNTEQSESFAWSACGSHLCDRCVSKHCEWTQRYADGSSIKAWVAKDQVQFAGLQKRPFILGCSVTEAKTIFRQSADGVMGLSMNSHSFVTQLGSQLFAHCFASEEHEQSKHFGHLVFANSADLQSVSTPIKWTPLLANDRHSWYRVKTVRLSVGEDSIPYSEDLVRGYKGTVFDTGSTTLSFPKESAKSIIEKLKEKSGVTIVPDRTKDYDWCLSGVSVTDRDSLLSKFPSVSVHFSGDVKLSMHSDDYIVAKKGRLCLDLFGDVPSILVGSNAMKDVWVIYDRKQRRLGIADARCDSDLFGGGSSDRSVVDSSSSVIQSVKHAASSISVNDKSKDNEDSSLLPRTLTVQHDPENGSVFRLEPYSQSEWLVSIAIVVSVLLFLSVVCVAVYGLLVYVRRSHKSNNSEPSSSRSGSSSKGSVRRYLSN